MIRILPYLKFRKFKINGLHNIYDQHKCLTEPKIIDVERGYYPEPYMYRVTIEFETFTGAHNPPFDTNIATYDIINFSPLEIKEINYEHYLTEE